MLFAPRKGNSNADSPGPSICSLGSHKSTREQSPRHSMLVSQRDDFPRPWSESSMAKRPRVLRRQDPVQSRPPRVPPLSAAADSPPKRYSSWAYPHVFVIPGSHHGAIASRIRSLRKQRGANQVNLFDLRRAMEDVSRSEFDLALEQLRRDHQISLASAEKAGGNYARGTEAAIREGDACYSLWREMGLTMARPPFPSEKLTVDHLEEHLLGSNPFSSNR